MGCGASHATRQMLLSAHSIFDEDGALKERISFLVTVRTAPEGPVRGVKELVVAVQMWEDGLYLYKATPNGWAGECLVRHKVGVEVTGINVAGGAKDVKAKHQAKTVCVSIKGDDMPYTLMFQDEELCYNFCSYLEITGRVYAQEYEITQRHQEDEKQSFLEFTTQVKEETARHRKEEIETLKANGDHDGAAAKLMEMEIMQHEFEARAADLHNQHAEEVREHEELVKAKKALALLLLQNRLEKMKFSKKAGASHVVDPGNKKASIKHIHTAHTKDQKMLEERQTEELELQQEHFKRALAKKQKRLKDRIVTMKMQETASIMPPS